MSPSRRTSPPSDLPGSSAPYGVQTRQASGSSKSKKREQFSACGACRMRRVRCDLKDLPGSSQQGVSCSNCKERGLKCVDEFAEVKAVKLLRRGRRLQQAEALYGKAQPEHDLLRGLTPPPSVIPRLAPEFFSSAFFARFQVQRPILEPLEFKERYLQFVQGNSDALPISGQLVAMALVVWAASFGVNEFGVEDAQDGPLDMRQLKEQVNDMLQELLYLVDLHGILRKATWDGVKLLLLLLPLTQEIQTPLDRLVMYETTLSQVYNLCNLSPNATINSTHGEYIDALARARLFWYAHITDGVTSGLRGGRILLSDYDLSSFETTLPGRSDGSRAADIYFFTLRCVALPIRISAVCRTIHAALTGVLARQRIREDLLHKAWASLDQYWTDLDALRNLDSGDLIEREDLDRFIHGWQIFIFECHNVIRENLKGKLVSPVICQFHDMGSDAGDDYERLTRLHDKAKARCLAVARDVVAVIQRNLGSPFFQYDASLVRDGCFFAAFLLASDSGTSEEVETCLQAMSEMRWVFSKSEERMHTVQMIWQSRVQQTHSQSHTPVDMMHDGSSISPADNLSYARRHPMRSLNIPPLTIPTGTSSRSSSAPNTSVTHDGSWPSSLSTGSSSTRTHSQPASIFGGSPITGRTPPYTRSPPIAATLALASSSKSPMMTSPTVVMPSLAFDRSEQPYLQPFGYAGLGEGPSHSHLTSHHTSPLMMSPYEQMVFHDQTMPYGAPTLESATDQQLISPVDPEEEAYEAYLNN